LDREGTLESMRRRSGLATTGTVNLAGSPLTCPCHVCAFYGGPEEQYDLLVPFLKEGLETGDRVFTIAAADEQADRVERLSRGGIDIEQAQRNGQFESDTWEEAYLRGGHFDADEMLVFVQDTINTGRQRGFARTRGWANMEWALTGAPGTERLSVYESRLNFILPLYNDAVVCAYDVRRFSASVLQDVARAHPYLLADGVVQKNPHYVPPEELVPEFESKLS